MQKETLKDNFVHLHVHNTFSFQDGYGTPDQYTDRCLEIGQTALATTNHGNVSDHFKFYSTCVKKGIKPILGCEFYIAPNKEYSTNKRYHITVLAKNAEGYKHLLQLTTKGWENFNHKPLVKMEDLIKLQKGLVVLSGCGSGKVSKLVLSGDINGAEKELVFLKNNIDDFYVEIMPVHFGEFGKIIPVLYNLAKKLNIPMVATMDCHYVLKEQSFLQEILLCIQSNGRMDDPKRWKFDQTDFYLKSRKEMCESFAKINPELNFSEAFDNTTKIANMINFKFPTASPISFPIPEKEKKEKLFQMCMDGIKKRGFLSNEKYKQRMEYEFDLIIKKDFVDYFLIMTDIVMWAKNNDILTGPARGSSAGSLICYLLRISEVDPLVHGLIFERFIDINREDMPDIDVDFEDAKRPRIKKYLEEKYGKGRVGQLATFSKFKGKSIISDFGRIYGLPYGVATKLKSIIIERSGGDSRASFTIEDTFKQFDLAKQYLKDYPFLKYTKDFEGQLRNISSHASGIIVSNEPILDFCAMYLQRGDTVMSMDYEDANSLGFTKLDILGLNTLTSVSKALKLVKKRTGKNIDIYNLPLDDKKVYKGFKNPKKLFGIFQFDGQSVNQVCRQVVPGNFEELTAINALSRPGPMHGMDKNLNIPITTLYIQRKNGILPINYAHKLLEPITKETQGVVIYQEQVMKTMRNIGKMSWKDTANIRKLISKSRGIEAFEEYQDKFAIGARENGLTESEIDNIWSAMSQHGCLSGDSKIKIKSGHTIKLKELYKKWERAKTDGRAKQFDFKCMAFDNGDGLVKNEIKNVICSGIKKTYTVKTNQKNKIKSTLDHKFLTPIGWKPLAELSAGDLIAVQFFPTHKPTKQINNLPKKSTHNTKWKRSMLLLNQSRTNSAVVSSEKRSKSMQKWWDKNPDAKIGLINRIPEEKLNTWGVKGKAKDGHIYHSLNGLKLENWLIKNKLEHIPHPAIQYNIKTNRPRKADQLVKGFYIEMDGMGRSEKFWKEKYKDSIDRLILLKPGDNLDSNLKFLKKKKISYLGKDKSFANHREIKWKMIQSITYFGKEKTYDISMENPYNSFISDNFIVHNSWSFNKSHSVSYSIISYWCMYLKVYYPIEFYSAMTSTMLNNDKIRKVIKEYIREGFELLPIDINRSEKSFSIDESNLRLGFAQIKGIGDKVIDKIIENQPYTNVDDFENKTKIGKRVIDILSKLGVFDSIGGTTKTVRTLFGEEVVEKYETKITFNERLKLCPLAVDFNMTEKWKVLIKKYIKWKISKIENLDPEKGTETIMGIVYDKNLKDKIEEALTRGKKPPQIINGQAKYCNFVLEDDTDFVTVRISTQNFQKFQKLIFEEIDDNSTIMVKGRMGDGIRMFFANEIICLNHLKDKIKNKKEFTESELILTEKRWKNKSQ